MSESKIKELAVLEQIVSQTDLPPIHHWNPANTGTIDIVIQRDGRWIHEGHEITRKELVRLFASILRLDPDGYYLVTPQEKLKVTVINAPFNAISLEVFNQNTEEQVLMMKTNLDDSVIIRDSNRLWVSENPVTGEPSPYIHVRHGLNALVSRSVFYELIDLGKIVGKEMVIKSANEVFSLGKISDT